MTAREKQRFAGVLPATMACVVILVTLVTAFLPDHPGLRWMAFLAGSLGGVAACAAFAFRKRDRHPAPRESPGQDCSPAPARPAQGAPGVRLAASAPPSSPGNRSPGPDATIDAVPRPAAGAPTALPDGGRGGEIYAETIAAELTDWSDVANRLLEALERDEFRLYTQRIVPLSFIASRLPFHEMLVRLQEKEAGLMPPGAFLPLAERHGLLPALDRWVLRHVLEWIAGDKARQAGCYSINVSAATIVDPGFPEFLTAELDGRGLQGLLLCFEIAESEAHARMPETSAFVEGVRERGCQTALCGFGKSLSSFGALRHLAVDFLKIDAGIVQGMAANPVDAAKVKAIVRIANDTRRRTIAECVEDEATLAQLHAIGVDYAQGFGVSRPVPLANPG
jgi:EAL domain-containing protein (putative c-di-GMP-specific phosphodiesterase class I)